MVPSSDPPRRHRPLRRAVVGVLLVALLLPLAAVAVIALLPGPALRAGLRLAGHDVTFDRVRFDLDDLELRGLRVGTGPDHLLDRLTIRYQPARLLDGRVDAIEIDGLVVRARLDDQELRLAGVDSGEDDDGGAPAPPLPWPDRVVVRDSRVELATPWGDAMIPADGELRARDGRGEFVLEVADAVLAFGSGRIVASVRIEGETVLASDTALDEVEGAVRGEVSAVGFTLPGLGTLDGDGALQAALRPGHIEATVEGSRLAVRELAAEWSQVAAIVPPPWRIELSRPLTLEATRTGDAVTLEGNGTVAVAGAGPTVVLAASASLALQPGMAATLAVRDGRVELRDVSSHGMRVQRGVIGFSGSGTPDAFEGMLDLELAASGDPLPDLRLDDVVLNHTLQARFARGDLQVHARQAGALTARAIWQSATEVDLSARLEPTETLLLDARLTGDAFDWASIVAASVPQAAVTADGGGRQLYADLAATRLDVEFRGSGAALESAEIAVEGGELNLPDHAITMEKITTEVGFTAAGLDRGRPIPLRIESIVHRGRPPWFAPLQLDATLRAEGEQIPFEARLTQPSGALELRLSGAHDLVGGSGQARVELPPMTFAGDTVQPARLAPVLGEYLEEVSGRVAADGTVAWTVDGTTRADLALLLEELAFTSGPARLEQVNGIVTFDHLLPLTTPAGQQLAVGLLDFGLPLTDGIVSFRLEPDPALAIDALTWRFAGGTVRAGAFRVGSAESELTVTLEAEGLDLDQLFALTRLDGLTGEGSIGGTLPVTVRDGEALITGGVLVADGPGWLRYRPGAAPAALRAGGENVSLLLEALENFRYEALRITLDGRTDTDMDVRLHLAGANPDLYDGYPIEFNLNLEGELGNLLRSGLASYQIPDRIRERMQGFRR